MTIRDLIDNLTIQGAFEVYYWDYELGDSVTVCAGQDFECDQYNMSEATIAKRIAYMYAVEGVLHIEIEK